MKHPRGHYYASTFNLLRLTFDTIFRFKKDTRDVSKKFKFLISEFLETKNHIILTPSFRIALYLTLNNLKKNNLRDQVLITSLTIPDTINAIRLAGLNYEFVETDAESHSIDFEHLKKMSSSKTLAILVTHLSGNVTCKMREISDYCKGEGTILIEDFSQAYGNENTLKYADYSLGSLSTGKTISTLVGGMICTKDDAFSQKITNEMNYNSHNLQRKMILFQIIDSLKINFFCNRIIFTYFTFYLLQIFKKLFPSHYNDLEQARTITRVLNQDIFFENCFSKREEFPWFFFYKLTYGQITFAINMLKEFESRKSKRRTIFSEYLNFVNHSIVPSDFFQASNNYYHLPIKTFGKKELIQQHFLKKGIDISSYGLPLCHHFFTPSRDLPVSEEVKFDTLFVPLSELYSIRDAKRLATITNEIYSHLKLIPSIKVE